MSRTDADQNVWTVTTEMPDKVIPDGQQQAQQLQTYRSQKIGAQSTQINTQENRGVLAIWMTLQLLANEKKNVSRFVPWQNHGMIFDVFGLITSFVIGNGNLNTVVNYALCLKDRPITRGLFKINFHPDVLVEAVLHGDETMTRRILSVKPDLTEKGTGIDFSGRKFVGTALQAAIAATDFSPNENSTGLFELIVEKLKEQYPDHWHQLFHDQALELYTKSLRVYAEKQADKIRALTEKKDNGETIDDEVINTAIARHQTYLEALHSNDLTTIINTHTNPDPDPTKPDILDAQKDHVFQINQALIDKIAAVSDTEIQAVLDDHTIDSPLSNLLKQFRSDFEKLSQEEIIFNSQHFLKIFNLYDEFHDRVERTDPNWKKRELFWCHLVGFIQRYLPANIAQIFANPGLFDTVEENMKNARVFDFKNDGNSIFPLSFDSNSGLGYKFAVTALGVPIWHSALGVWPGRIFSKLMSSKNSKLSSLCNNREHAPTSLSVVAR